MSGVDAVDSEDDYSQSFDGDGESKHGSANEAEGEGSGERADEAEDSEEDPFSPVLVSFDDAVPPPNTSSSADTTTNTAGSSGGDGDRSLTQAAQPETLRHDGFSFVVESSVADKLRCLFAALDTDASSTVKLDQVLFLCLHAGLSSHVIRSICRLVVPHMTNHDRVDLDQFNAFLCTVKLAQQRQDEKERHEGQAGEQDRPVCPDSLADLKHLDPREMVDVGLAFDSVVVGVDPPPRLNVGRVVVDAVKARPAGAGMYRHILYDVVVKVGEGWEHLGTDRPRVQRRYSDFVWLQERLQSKYKAVILPPLPGKKVLGNMQTAFVEKRRRALVFYLNRIGEHGLLRSSLEFSIFISATPQGIDALQKVCAKVKSGSWSESAKGLVTSVFSTLGTLAGAVKTGPVSSLQAPNRNGANGKAGTSASSLPPVGVTTIEQDQMFSKITQKFTSCSGHITKILERSEDLQKHRQSMAREMQKVGHAVAEIGEAEKKLRLQGTEGVLLVGELLGKVAKLDQDTHESFEATHIAQLKFEVGKLEMAQGMLHKREELFQHYWTDHRKRHGGENKESVSGPEEATKVAEVASKGIQKEVQRFEASKQTSLHGMLSETAHVMQQSSLRQKLLWGDLARVLHALSYEAQSAGSPKPSRGADPPMFVDATTHSDNRSASLF